jgi:hypothetical protein
LGCCLTSNHVHLIAVPLRPDSFARAMRRTHSIYAQSCPPPPEVFDTMPTSGPKCVNLEVHSGSVPKFPPHQ